LSLRLQRIAACQLLGEIDRDDPARDWLRTQAQALSPEDVQLYYQICLHGKRDLVLAPDLGTGFEMTLLRMFAFRPMQIEQTSPTRESSAIREVKSSIPPAPAVPVQPVTAPKVVDGRDDESAAVPASAGQWAQIVPRLGLKGVTQQLAVHCTLSKHEGDRIELILDAGHANLCTPNAQARLQDALRSYFKASTLNLKITMGSNLDTPAKQLAERQSQRELQARQAIEQDPTVDAFQQLLGAKVQAVKPLD
jgi:DNA polymerase-3 subunit gamma/tau